MNISETDYLAIKDFAEKFREYHEVANDVFAVSNGRKHMSDTDFKSLREDEKHMRYYLNEEFGNLEQIIINLMGGKLFLTVPNIPGSKWDVFAEALSSSFTIVKGDSLSRADDELTRLVGKAKSIAEKKDKQAEPSTPVTSPSQWFSDGILSKITDNKIKALCIELNNVFADNPNATALLMRTILLLTLQKKLGNSAKDDLRDVMNQAISQDVYKDVHIKRVLTNLSTIPKTMLDASHHSKWVIIKKDDLGIWLPGLVNVVEATFQ